MAKRTDQRFNFMCPGILVVSSFPAYLIAASHFPRFSPQS